MTILVTGASGFIGSAVVRALLARGSRVRVLVRPSSDLSNLRNLPVDLAQGDLCDAAALRRACAGCSGLYHLAADYRLWTREPATLYASNVTGTAHLMEVALAAKIPRIVYTSSVATLGLHQDGHPANENTPVALSDMIGHYKRSKFLAEQLIDTLVVERGLPVVIVNPSTPIGPHDIRPTPTGRMIRDAYLGKIPAFVDTGLNLVHVDDVAQGHLLAFDKGAVGRRYILGGENLSLRQILTAIAHLAQRAPPVVQLPRLAVLPVALVGEAWAWLTNGPEPQITLDGLRMSLKKMYFDSGRAQRELGYVSRPAVLAIADAVEWFSRGRAQRAAN
ncbi:MAG: NAD-dependent epimerase/dehydratase family protein [Gammaproteobacteria bacterium]|nr:NAD-dependent epimerase/dehydratase family protein [Gammaproteobacteria bacterium]